MAVTASDIRDAFSGLSDVKVDSEMEAACLSLCLECGFDATAVAAEWELLAMKHSTSDSEELLRKLGDALRKQAAKKRASDSGSRNFSTPISGGRTVKRMAGQSRRVEDFGSSGKGGIPFDTARLVNSAASKKSRMSDGSPLVMAMKNSAAAAAAADAASPGLKYSERSNMGKVELSFNEELGLNTMSNSGSENSGGKAVSLSQVQGIKSDRYMYYTLEQRADALEDQINACKKRYMEIHGWSEDDFVGCGTVTQEPALVCGRICCEAHEGRANSRSLVLEGSRLESAGMRVRLDIDSSLRGYALFPGQIVVIKGICPDRHTLFAKEVFTDLELESSSKQDQVESDQAPDAGSSSHISVFAAAGPFTTSGDLAYDPLEDLLANVVEAKPDVLILMGPFVDANHRLVSSGDCSVTLNNGKTINLRYDQLFEMRLARIIAVLEDVKTRVVVVPSLKDVHHSLCFPQPAFDKVNLKELGLNEAGKVVLASNPCVIHISDGTGQPTSIAINTQDIIKDLASTEVARKDPKSPDAKQPRVQRLVSHLVKQASFYPLFPCAQDALVDFTQFNDFQLHEKPDILLLSSMLQYFCYDVKGTTCINPGKLTRGSTGGIYAKIFIKPLASTEQSETKPPTGRTQVEIVRI